MVPSFQHFGIINQDYTGSYLNLAMPSSSNQAPLNVKTGPVDLLLALVLLSPPTSPKVTLPTAPDDTTTDPIDQPSNYIVPNTIYDEPTEVPKNIGDILSQVHRTDLPNYFTRETSELATHETSAHTSYFFGRLNPFVRDDFLYVDAWDRMRVFETPWTKPAAWGSGFQVRRPIHNEACVDVTVTQNVVEPIVACLEVLLDNFLDNLNKQCQEAFGIDFSFSLQVRHETSNFTGDVLLQITSQSIFIYVQSR
ncbi:hypothetical protein DL96DRAFT_237131 [Flagelloscypha sp. PMI_526]|nr:hypothetical protein DL96DRAFT_237131 [Flagelloscypha sp. PMI_526]